MSFLLASRPTLMCVLACGFCLWTSEVHGLSQRSHDRFPWQLGEISGAALPHSLSPYHYLMVSPDINRTRPYLSFYDVAPVAWRDEIFFQAPLNKKSKALVRYHSKRFKSLGSYPLSDHLAVAPWVSEGEVVVATRDGWIRCFQRQSSQLLWQRELSSYAVKRLLVQGRNLFTQTAASQAVSLSLDDGKLRWVSALQHHGSLFMVDRRAIELAEGLLWVGGSHSVEVFDQGTGEWLRAYRSVADVADYGTSQSVQGVIAPWILQGEHLIFTRWDGEISAFLKSDSSRPVWNHSLGAAVVSAWRSADEMFYGTLDGQLLVWNISRGRKTHALPLSSSPITSVSLLEKGVLLALSRDGELMGVHVEDKRPLFYRKSQSTFYAHPLYAQQRSLLYLVSGYQNLYTYQLNFKSF